MRMRMKIRGIGVITEIMQLCVVMCGKESASKQESASSEQGVRRNNKCYVATTNLMQICFSHSCQQQAASSKQSEQRAASREQRAARTGQSLIDGRM